MRLFLSLGVITAANLLLWFGFQWLILAKLGPGSASDAFFAAVTVPQLILMIVAGSLANVLVPFFSGEQEEEVRRDTYGILIVIGAMFVFLSVLIGLSAGLWVPYVFPGFLAQTAELCITLTRIQLVGMVFIALNGVLSASFNARHRFVQVELTGLVGTLLAFGALYVALPLWGVTAASWATVVRVAFQTLVLLPLVGRVSMRGLSWSRYRSLWSRIKPLLLGTSYFKTDQLVDRFLSSLAAVGSLSIYYFSQQIYSAGNQVLAKAICTPMMPRLAGLAKEGNWSDFRQLYRKKLMQMSVLTLAGYLLIVVAGRPVLDLLSQWGSIKSHDMTLLWSMLVALVGSFVGANAGLIVNSASYAAGDTSTPAKVMSITYTVGIAAKAVGFLAFGLVGLAVATSLYYFAYPLFSWLLLEKDLAGKIQPASGLKMVREGE